MRRVLAADLGGTWLRAAVVTEDGTIVRRAQVRTPTDDPRPTALIEVCRSVIAGEAVDSAIIGVPGRVDHARGALEHAPNVPAVWAADLTETRLSAAIGVPVALANDADLAAVGEWAYGAARGFDDVAYITVSTGIGAGVILGGRIVRGRRSIGEIGHAIIDRQAARRGQPATVETLGSGTALARGGAPLGFADAAEVVAAALRGDPGARAVFDDAIDAISVGIVDLAFLFSPSIVVIGGGVSRIGDLLFGPVRARLHASGPPGLPQPIRVVGAVLGDDAGLIGGAAWGRATA